MPEKITGLCGETSQNERDPCLTQDVKMDFKVSNDLGRDIFSNLFKVNCDHFLCLGNNGVLKREIRNKNSKNLSLTSNSKTLTKTK